MTSKSSISLEGYFRNDCEKQHYIHTDGRLFTVKSFGEDQNWDTEEDEEVDNLLTVVLDVVSKIFDEDRSSRGQLDTSFSGGAERLATLLRTAHNNDNNVSYVLSDGWDDMSAPFCSVPVSANVYCA